MNCASLSFMHLFIRFHICVWKSLTATAIEDEERKAAQLVAGRLHRVVAIHEALVLPKH